MKYPFIKNILLLLLTATYCYKASAQADVDTSLQYVELDGVSVRPLKIEQFRKSFRSERIDFMLHPNQDDGTNSWNDIVYLSKFDLGNASEVLFRSINLRVEPFDTSQFELYVHFFQIADGDTTRREILLNPIVHQIKRSALVLNCTSESIIVRKGAFYLGYGFMIKHIDKMLPYRIYGRYYPSSGEDDDSSISIKNGNIRHDTMGLRFPFKISYSRM